MCVKLQAKNSTKKDRLEAKHKPRKEEDYIKGIPISDRALGEEDREIKVTSIGVELSEDEKAFLKLPKSATDFVQIDEEKVETNIQVMAAKLRMALREQSEGGGVASQGLEEQEALLASQRVFDRETGSADFRKLKVTELPTCKRITVPDAAKPAEEAKIQVLIDGLEEVMKKCEKAEKRCPRAGNSKASTLSDQQLRGKESLQRREKAGELIMVGSDKSGKNIPMSVDLYKSCMEAHIKDDSEHTHEEVAQVEKTLNGAATQILRIFKCGEDWGHEDRLKSACLARNNEIPSLNQLVKDHKETLQTRPVCRAKQAPNGNLGEIICNILDPFVEEADKEKRTELRSTEVLCHEIKAMNERVALTGTRKGPYQEDGNMVVGSKDVKSFYPNMDTDVAAEEVKQEIEESNIDLEMDTNEAALYLACTMTPEEIEQEGLTHVVHKRRFKTGPRPGLTSKAIVGGAAARLEDQAWIPPARKPGRRQKKRMAGCVMKSACRLVMRNHFYSYNNSIRKQSKGGAIGNKLTEKLGRLLMKRHDKKYHGLLRKLKIEEELSERFVDDELEILTATAPGVRFEEGKLFKDETKVEEDKKIPDDERTFDLLRNIGNSIFECVQFTVDVPTANPNGRMAVLDLEVAVNGEKVEHGHFEKACAAEVVIPFTSAHSRKMKMSIMVEEGVRRLRNGARGLDWERSRSVMELWSRKLRRSGYPATMRHEMIGASVRRFEEMCAEEDRGGRPVHRSRDWKVKERQRLKEMKKSNWHKAKDNQVSAPLILDPTSGSMTKEMKAVSRKFEEVTGWRVPVVERAGTRVSSIAKAEPLRRSKCGREDCFPCKTGGGNCRKNGAGYRITCKRCLQVVTYEGETGSNGYSRGKEHQCALELKQEENALWKHCLVAHEGEKVEFSMQVVGTFQSCLVRQVNEGGRIKRSKAELMNSKGEFHQHPVVRVVPTRGLQNEPGELAGGRGGRGQARGRQARGGARRRGT